MQKKILIWIAALVTLVLLFPYFVSAFVPRNSIQQAVVAEFKAWSGLDVEVQGNASVEGYPFPHIVLRDLVVHNTLDASASPFFLTIRSLALYPSLSALFSGSHTFETVKLDGVNLSLEQLKDHSLNWKKLTTSGAGVATLLPDMIARDVHIDDASISYTDDTLGTSRSWDDIHILLLPSTQEESSVKVGFHYNSHDITINGKVSGLSNVLNTGTLMTDVQLTSGRTQLNYVGEAGVKADALYLKGNAALGTDDISPWYMSVIKHTDDSSAAPSVDAKGNPFTALPLQARSAVLAENSKTTLSDIELSGPIISGKLQASATNSNQWQLDGQLSELNLESILASRIFYTPATSAAQKSHTSVASDSTTDSTLVMGTDLKIDAIDYNNQHITDAHLAFDLENNEAVFSQATALFPGNSRLIFNGLGKVLNNGGLSLEGQIDAAGDDFFALTRLLKLRGVPLPAEDLKRFRIKANTVISPSEVRLSELAARVEALAITGGIVASLATERPQVQAELRIGGANLDHLFASAGLLQYAGILFSNEASRELTLDSAQKTLQWLQDISFDLKLSTELSPVTLNGKMRSDISADVYVMPRKLAINRLKTNYEGTQLSGEVALDITNTTPQISFVLNADTIDIPVPPETPAAASAQAAATDRWSSVPFNFYWLNHVDSSYTFSIDHLKYGVFQADNVSVKGGLENNTLHIDDMKGIALGAPFAARVSLRGGHIPVIETALSLQNLAVERIAPYVSLLKSMTGTYTLAARLSMSGDSMTNWVSTLSGAVNIAGSNVIVHGFNMPGIIRAVAYVRTVADILNVVKHAFPGGDTLFTQINGSWTISSGKMDISNTKIMNSDANGIITGFMDLPSWTTQQKIAFDLLALDKQNPPTISVEFRGNMDAPEKILDTHALEQYVTQKTSGKLLN